MRVCLINHSYKPFIGSGTENVVETIADSFFRNGDEVFIIAARPRFWQEPIPSLPYRVIYFKSSFYSLSRMPYIVRIFWHIFNLFDIFTALKVKSVLKREKPDLVITNNLAGLSHLVPNVISELKIKHFHILHDIQLLHPSGLLIWGQEKKIDNLPAKIYQFFLRRAFAKVDVIISPSQWLLDIHLRKGFFVESRKKVMVNPIVVEKMLDNRRDGNIFRILYATQIEEHKGIFFLIEAFNKFLEAGIHSQVKLIIVGGGAGQDQLCDSIRDNQNIEYLGRVDRARVFKEMGESNLLIVPSLCYENSPTVMFEGIGTGLPVLAADIGGVGEIVNKYGGILFDPGDIDDLNKKLNIVIKNPQQLEEIKNNYLRCHEELSDSADNYLRNLNSLFKNV